MGYSGENYMVLFNGDYDYDGSRESEWYGSDYEELAACGWCDEKHPEGEMMKREECGYFYCSGKCLKAVEKYEEEEL